MKNHWYTVAIIVGMLTCFFTGLLIGKRYNIEVKQTSDNITAPTNHQRKKSLKYCRQYAYTFDQYCLHKSGTYEFALSSDLTEQSGYLYVKEFCPDMYLEYIAPVKHVWDSLRLTKMDWNTYDIKNKIKIKVKDSKHVYINTDEKKK